MGAVLLVIVLTPVAAAFLLDPSAPVIAKELGSAVFGAAAVGVAFLLYSNFEREMETKLEREYRQLARRRADRRKRIVERHAGLIQARRERSQEA